MRMPMITVEPSLVFCPSSVAVGDGMELQDCNGEKMKLLILSVCRPSPRSGYVAIAAPYRRSTYRYIVLASTCHVLHVPRY